LKSCIFSYIPCKAVLKFRRVCKLWNNLICQKPLKSYIIRTCDKPLQYKTAFLEQHARTYANTMNITELSTPQSKLISTISHIKEHDLQELKKWILDAMLVTESFKVWITNSANRLSTSIFENSEYCSFRMIPSTLLDLFLTQLVTYILNIQNLYCICVKYSIVMKIDDVDMVSAPLQYTYDLMERTGRMGCSGMFQHMKSNYSMY